MSGNSGEEQLEEGIRELVREGLIGEVQNSSFEDAVREIETAAEVLGFSPGGNSGGGGGPGRGGPGGDNDHSDNNNVTLEDVGGLEDQIMYLRCSVIFPMANPGVLKPWGVTIPKGIMFYGPPGTGKTMIAKAIANEIGKELKTKVPFYYHKGADCLDKYFGQSETNLRAIFQRASKTKPSVLFFDEIDGLCPNRASSTGRGGSEAYASVVTTFLGLMDKITNGEVLVIAATNMIESVDPAVRRPGRFDKEMMFHSPDEQGRQNIIRIHTRNWKPISKPSDALLKDLASQTQGFTGAYLENLCTEALNAALERERQNQRGEEKFDIGKVSVKNNDWAVALSNMERPQTKIFGSNLLVAYKNSVTDPLLTNQLASLKATTMLNFPTDPNVASIFMLKTLLVWDNVATSNQDIEDYLIPALLNEPEIQKVPVYELNVHNIVKMATVFHQVCRSANPCILYIPRINILWEVLQYKKETDLSHLAFVLLNNLNLTRRYPVFVLATSNVPTYTMAPELSQVFEKTFKMRNPDKEERAEFFSKYPGQGWKKVEELLGQVGDLTEGQDIERLLQVHSSLHGIYHVHKNEEDVRTHINTVVNKLKIGESL